MVVALAAGALAGVSAPALAADPQLTATPDSVTIRAGSDVTVSAAITNPDPAEITVTLSFTGLPQGVSCSAGCADVEIPPNGNKTQLLTLRAANDAPAANGVSATLRAQGKGSAGNATDNVSVTVQPVQQAPQVVTEVSGQVYDLTNGQGISAATVAMQDGAGGQFSATADSQGRFKFTSTAGKPIVPGTILVGAVKDGYGQGQKEVDGKAGTVVANVRIGLKAIAATASAPPLPSAEALVPPSVDASADTGSGQPDTLSADSGSGGMFSMMLIAMGGLLVALGIGAIVLLLLRRRGDDEEDDEDEAPVPPRGGGGPRAPAPRPAPTGMYRSGPDPTMIPRAAAIGDRTMITRPAITDAATTMQRPVPTDGYPNQGYADPQYRGAGQAYGAPGYPSPQPPGYGPPPTPYGAGGGGYGSPAAPTSYGGAPGARYGGYEPEEPAPRYGGGGGYESGGYGPANGYDSGSAGYEQNYDHGGYGSGGANGYDQYGQPAGGYEPAGYEPRSYDSGYDQRVPEQRPGYGSGASYGPNGYDPYYDDGARQPGRAERRSLDWLDD